MRGRSIEIEQKAECLREIDVGKLPEHGFAIQPSVEKARQNRALQQRSPPVRFERQDGVRELREQDPAETRIKRADHHHDVAVATFQRGGPCDVVGGVLVDQPREHRGKFRGIVDEHRQVEQRNRFVRDAWVQTNPALVRRVEMLCGSRCRRR